MTDSGRSSKTLLPTLDGFVLPWQPAILSAEEYGRSNNANRKPADLPENGPDPDDPDHALPRKKPPSWLFATADQLLNVYMGGTAESGPADRELRTTVQPAAKT